MSSQVCHPGIMRAILSSLVLAAFFPLNASAFTRWKSYDVRSFWSHQAPIAIPKSFTRQDDQTLNVKRAEAVKEAFQFAWRGYSKYCFGKDELRPVDNTCSNPRNGWGASAIDALSTAVVMQIRPIVDEILELVPSIDFTTTDTPVSLFETTIRYLAGMLSAYDLLKDPSVDLASNVSAVDELLVQSKSLADTLRFAFDSPSGIPNNMININDKSTDGNTLNGLAVTGSLVLEWQRLSDLLNDSCYGDLAQKAESYLLDPRPASSEPFPGLVGSAINISNGNFLNARGGWDGGTDSFYEYLIKMYVYDPARYGLYKDRWILAADSTIEYLASHPSSRPELTFLSSYDERILSNSSSHLACFDGGSFLLGGAVLKRQDYINFGLALTKGCHETYKGTVTGIGPEDYSWDTAAMDSSQEGFYKKWGFYIRNSLYVLRPEVIESYYYAYRVTGESI